MRARSAARRRRCAANSFFGRSDWPAMDERDRGRSAAWSHDPRIRRERRASVAPGGAEPDHLVAARRALAHARARRSRTSPHCSARIAHSGRPSRGNARGLRQHIQRFARGHHGRPKRSRKSAQPRTFRGSMRAWRWSGSWRRPRHRRRIADSGPRCDTDRNAV